MCRCQWGVGVRHTFLPAGTQFNIFTHQLYKPQHPHLWSAILVYQTSSRKRFDRGREGRKSYASYLHMSLNSYKQGSTAVSFMDCAKMSQPKSQRGCPGDSHSRGSLGSILKKKKRKSISTKLWPQLEPLLQNPLTGRYNISKTDRTGADTSHHRKGNS